MQGLTLDLSQAVTSGSGNECKISVLILHTVVTDAQGAFRFAIPAKPLSLRVEGKNLDQIERNFLRGEAAYKILRQHSLLTIGSNFHYNQINVGLNHTVERNPIDFRTRDPAKVKRFMYGARRGACA